ncbi:MAG: metallophosphoesterase [Pseudomonadales bacterium]
MYFSDIHIEIRDSTSWTDTLPLGLGPDLTPFSGTADLVVLAGDIGRIRSRREVSTLTYARQVADYLSCEVAVVPGNHEYYRGSFDEVREFLLAESGAGVTVLDRGEARYPCRNTELRLLGATLWTDYAVLDNAKQGMDEALRVLPDHRLISRGSGAFQPSDALAEHNTSRAWLMRRLAEPHAGPTLIATHHVPHSLARNPLHGTTSLSPAFYSDCDDLLVAAAQSGVVGWICGHHHWSHVVEVHGVLLVSAQPGYPGEQTGWQGPGLLGI